MSERVFGFLIGFTAGLCLAIAGLIIHNTKANGNQIPEPRPADRFKIIETTGFGNGETVKIIQDTRTGKDYIIYRNSSGVTQLQ